MNGKSNQRVVAILQARMSSSRLPGKVLMPLMGKPMFIRQIERLRRCELLDEIIVATSDRPEDQQIAKACEEENIKCFRGSLNDVLDRYYNGAIFADRPEHVVRLTADCPLADPKVIDDCIKLHLEVGADYTSNTIKRHFPKGLDVEVMTFQSLKTAWENSSSSYDREHVTPFINQHPEVYSLAALRDLHNRENWRWTVDTADDMEMIRAVYNALFQEQAYFNTDDVIGFLNNNPEIARLNNALG